MPRLMTGLLLSCLLIVGDLAAQEPAVLRVNPFVRPPESVADTNGVTVDDSGMTLRGIVLAGDSSLANIGGRIIGIGQDVDGYRLVTVQEGKAVLERDGVQKVLTVKTRNGVGNEVQVNASW